ncbi:11369_t:CDS:1, partial [Gigaspora rosea]
TFKKLNGTVTVEQINEVNYTINLIFNKGFNENAPDYYFIDGSSFASVGITIDPHKAGPWNSTGSGDVDILFDYTLNITKNQRLLDKAKFVKE